MTWLRNSFTVAPVLMGMVFTGVCSAAVSGAPTDNDWFQGRSVRPADTAPAGAGQPGMGVMGGRDFGRGFAPQNMAPPGGPQGNQAGQGDFPADQIQDWVLATARAAHARAMLHLAEKRLNDSVRDSQWTFEQSKEYRDAVTAEKQAYDAYTAERRKALESVVKDPTYLAALQLSDELADKIHQVRGVNKSRRAPNEELLAMASQRMEYATQAHAMERAALEKDTALQDSRQKMVEANAKLTALQASFDTSVRMNPQIQQARQNLDEARVTLITAEAYASAAATAGDLATSYVFYRHRWDGLASPVVGPMETSATDIERRPVPQSTRGVTPVNRASARWMIAAMCWCMLAGAVTVRAAGSRHTPGPTSQPATEDPERKKWESRILFFGDESSGEWSLRIRDQDVDQTHEFRMPELWTYDRQTRRWTKLGTTPYKTTMVLPDQKPDAQKGEPDQILIVLPIEQDQVGLYYAKWAVDQVKGSTFFRIGPGLDKKSDRLKDKPPPGKIAAIVPINLKHAEAAMIADPPVACEP